jgi:alpha-tubulin suppressor-like RCC1 family protein
MAVKSDGSIVSWGWDDDEQVSRTPSATNFTTKMAAGEHRSFIIANDGDIVGWGSDYAEGLSKLAVMNNESIFTDVAAGGGFAYALVQ